MRAASGLLTDRDGADSAVAHFHLRIWTQMEYKSKTSRFKFLNDEKKHIFQCDKSFVDYLIYFTKAVQKKKMVIWKVENTIREIGKVAHFLRKKLFTSLFFHLFLSYFFRIYFSRHTKTFCVHLSVSAFSEGTSAFSEGSL